MATGTGIVDRLDAIHARTHRWRWPVRLVLALILVPWAVHVVYTRMTVMPPSQPSSAMEDVPFADTADVERAKQLLAILDKTRTPATVGPPPSVPPGRKWVSNDGNGWWMSNKGQSAESCPLTPGTFLAVQDALRGTWDLQNRYLLPRIVTYVTSPAVQDAVDKAAALAKQPFCMPDMAAMQRLYWEYEPGSMTAALAVRARWHIAEQRDVEAAARDIAALLDLAAGLEDDGSIHRLPVAQSIRQLALTEVTYWPREVDLSPADAKVLARVLDEHALDLPRRWKEAVAGDHALVSRMMDQWYTRDEDGDGWYVPHRSQPDSPHNHLGNLTNVISLVLADRRTMEAKIAEGMRRAADAADLPYPQARKVLVGSAVAFVEVPNPADGPFVRWFGHYESMYAACLLNLARHDVARVSLALAAYKREHGRYPTVLSDFVPAYLPAVPVSPITGETIEYRLDDTHGYAILRALDNWDEVDWHLSGFRDEAWADLRLVGEDEPVRGHDG